MLLEFTLTHWNTLFECCNFCTSSDSCSHELPWAVFANSESSLWASTKPKVGTSSGSVSGKQCPPPQCAHKGHIMHHRLEMDPSVLLLQTTKLPLPRHCPVGMNDKLQFAYFQHFSRQLGCILLSCAHPVRFLYSFFFLNSQFMRCKCFLLGAVLKPGSARVSNVNSASWDSQKIRFKKPEPFLLWRMSLCERWCFSTGWGVVPLLTSGEKAAQFFKVFL